MAKKRRHKPHWYRFYIGCCPVCCSDASMKERVYGKKPKDINKRYIYLDDKMTYDHCLEFGSIDY